jgi:predicted LPLAT superfamily acyltransferase
MTEGKKQEWSGKTAGADWMHRASISIVRYIPLPLVYTFVSIFVIPWCMLINHKGYLAIWYFMRRRMKYSFMKSFFMTYINHCRFAEIIIDRFYMYGGGKFKFDIPESDIYKRYAQDDAGFVILSAHVGNYEIAGYELVADKKKFNALVYAKEAQVVMNNRQKLFVGNNLNMILIQDDMSHLFEINNALARGESVSIPADRVFGSPRTVSVPFLGDKADFPLGPFAIAVQRELPVLAIHVMKTGVYHYTLSIRELSQGEGNMKQRAAHLAKEYAAHLESVVKEHPEQWFNYFDFFNGTEHSKNS